MSEQVALGQSATTSSSGTAHQVNTAADLSRLRTEGHPLTSQELKELNTRVKAFEEMARIEDRLRLLENRKRTSEAIEDSASQASLSISTRPLSQPYYLPSHRPSSVQSSVERDSSSELSDDIIRHRHKRLRYTRGIKVTPSYTLKVSSSLREWGDWRKDIERVFEGDPKTYQTGSQKILKALDYLDTNLKTLWYTFSDKERDVKKWSTFLTWTRDNIQHGQNATATLYEQLNAAKQLPDKSPARFNAYLSAIERELPQQDPKASAMTFYSKLTPELKQQFKTSDITIPETRAQCVSVAQRVWEGLYGPERRKDNHDYRNSEKTSRSSQDYTSSGPKHSRPDSRRDRKDRYHISHRKQEREISKDTTDKRHDIVCYLCKQSGHYATDCPKRKEQKPYRKAKVQSAQQPDSSPQSSPCSSPHSSSEELRTMSDSSESEN
jgi:hypothetical protein